MMWLRERPAPAGSALDRALLHPVLALTKPRTGWGLPRCPAEVAAAQNARGRALAEYAETLSASDREEIEDELAHCKRVVEGNSAVVRCTPDGVTVESLGPVPSGTTYTVDEARDVIVRYFDFLAPSADDKKRHLATWERENGRPFPGRALLRLAD